MRNKNLCIRIIKFNYNLVLSHYTLPTTHYLFIGMRNEEVQFQMVWSDECLGMQLHFRLKEEGYQKWRLFSHVMNKF